MDVPVLVKQPFTEALQIQVGSNGYSRGGLPRQYLEGPTLGPKVHLLDQTRRRPSVSFSAEVTIPSFRGVAYVRTYDALMTGYVTKDLGPIDADLNMGFNVWRGEERPLPQEFAALVLSMNLFAPVGGAVEAYTFTNAAPVVARDGGLLFALSQAPRPWLIFDERLGVGFSPATRAFSLFVGAMGIPAVLWPTKAAAS